MKLTRIQGDTLGKAWDMIIVEYEAAAAVGENVQIFIRRTPAEDDGYNSIAAVGNYRPDQIEGLAKRAATTASRTASRWTAAAASSSCRVGG